MRRTSATMAITMELETPVRHCVHPHTVFEMLPRAPLYSSGVPLLAQLVVRQGRGDSDAQHLFLKGAWWL